MAFMDYVDYRNHHLPIGSGVTEAACKTDLPQLLTGRIRVTLPPALVDFGTR